MYANVTALHIFYVLIRTITEFLFLVALHQNSMFLNSIFWDNSDEKMEI